MFISAITVVAIFAIGIQYLRHHVARRELATAAKAIWENDTLPLLLQLCIKKIGNEPYVDPFNDAIANLQKVSMPLASRYYPQEAAIKTERIEKLIEELKATQLRIADQK